MQITFSHSIGDVCLHAFLCLLQTQILGLSLSRELKFAHLLGILFIYPFVNTHLWNSNVVPNYLYGARATTMNTIDMPPLSMEFVIHWKERQLKASMKNLLIVIGEVGVWTQDLGGV